MIVEPTNLHLIRQMGIDVLNRELGPVATIRFIQQFEIGCGDYANDRHFWLDKMGLDDILKMVHKRRDIESTG